MAIKDLSGWPDHLVPAWVRRARIVRREHNKRERNSKTICWCVINECKSKGECQGSCGCVACKHKEKPDNA